MDIRKWLTSPKTSKQPTIPQVTNKKKSDSSPKREASKVKKRRVISSDSDEDPLPSSKKTSTGKDSSYIETSNKKKSPLERTQQKDAVVKTEKKAVTVSDFFGSSFVNLKEKKAPQKLEVKAIEHNHDDDDFSKTLGKLDKEEKSVVKVIKKIKGKSDEHSSIVKTEPNNDSKNIKSEKSSSPAKKSTTTSKKDKINDKVTDSSVSKKKTNINGKTKSKYESIAKIELIPNPVKKPATVVVDNPVPKVAPGKRRSGNSNYYSYLEREGPKALGSKEIPEGEENCLEKLSFIISGILESMERDEAKALVEKYGGKVMSTISKNTNYIVIGRDAGASKMEKAEKFGTKQLDEDGLLDLIRTMPGKGTNKKNPKKKVEVAVPKKQMLSVESDQDLELMFLDDGDSFSEIKSPPIDSLIPPKAVEDKSVNVNNKKTTDNLQKSPIKERKVHNEDPSMWVDKYKPTSLKQLIGQQGDKCNAKKLLNWLLSWCKNRKLNKKPGFAGRFNSNDDGSGYKAALLSGPPGVGKTTTSQLICKEARFDFFELNASDTRSKKSLQQVVSQLLGNQTLADCFNVGNADSKVSQNHVIIMDEVDGMAGNEDRGGVQELIGLIKSSRIPIICICNDRNHPKIRSLANHCFDLRFPKPRVEQIKAAMMSVAFKEGVKISPNALQDVIVASNQDIRQVLHNLSLWSAKESSLTPEQVKADIGKGTKHIKMGPFDVLREVFAMGNNPKATVMDKSDLFFHDYSIGPLFVQENYVHVLPSAAGGDKKKHLRLLSETADSICIGDLIERQIRSQNSWSLLPTQAIFASVVPGELMKGHLKQMINFPVWLGKNSNRNHMDRILQELHKHMRMRVSGNKTDVALEYLPLLKRALTKPLIDRETEGISDVLKTMKEYYLLREDFDSIIELSLWSQQTDPRTKISTKVKSAFTRTYNKECGANPYAVSNVKKKKRSGKDEEDLLDDENDIVSEEDDSLENDAMVKVKKLTKKNESSDDKPKASSSKPKKPRLKK